MLLGFPLDHRTQECIESAISTFGRLTFWEDDRLNLHRLIIRARVTDLDQVPQFLVISDGENFIGTSWTVQCM